MKRPPLAGDLDRVGEDVVRDLGKAQPQRPDLDDRAGVVLLDREGLLDQLLVPPGPDDGAEGLAGAGRDDQPRAGRVVGAGMPGHRHRLLARGQQQRVGVRDRSMKWSAWTWEMTTASTSV